MRCNTTVWQWFEYCTYIYVFDRNDAGRFCNMAAIERVCETSYDIMLGVGS